MKWTMLSTLVVFIAIMFFVMVLSTHKPVRTVNYKNGIVVEVQAAHHN